MQRGKKSAEWLGGIIEALFKRAKGDFINAHAGIMWNYEKREKCVKGISVGELKVPSLLCTRSDLVGT